MVANRVASKVDLNKSIVFLKYSCESCGTSDAETVIGEIKYGTSCTMAHVNGTMYEIEKRDDSSIMF